MMVEKKSKVETRKKVSRKKVAKKVAKKAATKKTTKKTVTKKVAKKVLRKKAAEKKPIKLKADSPELDSFAEHAAESVAGIEEAAVSLEAVVANETEKAESNNLSAADVYYRKPDIEDEIEVEMARPVVSQQSNITDSESFTGKLIVALVLFIGVGFYINDIFDQNDRVTSAPEVAQITTSVAKTTIKPLPAEKAVEVKVEITPAVVVEPADTKETTVAMPETIPESPAVANEKTVQPVKPKPAPVEKHFPPPPTPDFLRPMAKKPLPADQMEIIKQTFAPELYH